MSRLYPKLKTAFVKGDPRPETLVLWSRVNAKSAQKIKSERAAILVAGFFGLTG
jgi:hypothetical protein